MPKIKVEIEWDGDEHWLNADNVSTVLHAQCPNTRFVVRSLYGEANETEEEGRRWAEANFSKDDPADAVKRITCNDMAREIVSGLVSIGGVLCGISGGDFEAKTEEVTEGSLSDLESSLRMARGIVADITMRVTALDYRI